MQNLLYAGYYVGRSDNPKAPLMRSGEQPSPSLTKEVLGAKSVVAKLAKNVLMIDCDNQVDCDAMDKAVATLNIKVPTMITTRGKHYYFSNNGLESKCFTGVRLACGIKCDIKDGAKNAFDCIKIDGDFRRWVNADAPLQVLPKAFYPLSIKLESLSGMSEGSRNQTIINEVGMLKRYGFSYPDVKHILSVMNSSVFADPLPTGEFIHATRESLYNNAYSRKKKGPAKYDNNQSAQFETDSEELEELSFDVVDAGDNKQPKKRKQKAREDEDKAKFDHVQTSNELIEKYNIINVDGLLMRYDDGVYVPCDKNALERIICLNYPELTIRKRAEVHAFVRATCPLHGVNDADKYLDYFVFSNGTFKYEAEKNTLVKVDNDPERIIFNRVPHNYNPVAFSNTVNNFINDLACNNSEVYTQIIECMGHCLMRRNSIRGVFLLLGNTCNGKSTFLNVLSNLLGGENVSSIKMHELSDRFSRWQIGYKLANLGDDISSEYIPDTNIIKSVATSDTITVERKGKDGYKITPYCTMIFSANDLPRLKDNSNAALNRITIIPFNATFNSRHPHYNPNLAIELASPECMEALLNLAVWGLITLKRNKQLTHTSVRDAFRFSYATNNNPVLSFIMTEFWDPEIPVSDGGCCQELLNVINATPREIHNSYMEYCAEERLTPLGKTKFTNEFLRYFYNVSVQLKMVQGARCWRFCKIDPELPIGFNIRDAML